MPFATLNDEEEKELWRLSASPFFTPHLLRDEGGVAFLQQSLPFPRGARYMNDEGYAGAWP